MAVGGAKDADLEIATAKYPEHPVDHRAEPSGRRSPRRTSTGSGQPAGRRRSAGSRPSATSSAASCTRRWTCPIGLINDAWGGSACEAWIRRDILAADAKYAPLLKRWEKLEKNYRQAEKDELRRPSQGQGRGQAAAARPQNPEDQMAGNARPGNIYNGVLKPTIGYGIRGRHLVPGRDRTPAGPISIATCSR